jgi:hypothetical protein
MTSFPILGREDSLHLDLRDHAMGFHGWKFNELHELSSKP